MAISNLKYKEVELKPTIRMKEIDMNQILKSIPAEEIKEYIISSNEKNVSFEMSSFTNHFRKYFPKAEYDFYYNNLFNLIILKKHCISKTEAYINKARQYLIANEFEEVFKIIKSIIEAYNDTNQINYNGYVFDFI